MAWVKSNKALIRQIASPYRRYMTAEASDLNQEAILSAFCAIRETRRKGYPEDQLAPFFRVIFKTNCIRLSSGINTMDCPEIDNVAAPDRQEQMEAGAERELIEKALKNMSRRQREICGWLLKQPEPISTPLLRSWLRPHRGISQEKLPFYLGLFEFAHNMRRGGKALLSSLVSLLVMAK